MKELIELSKCLPPQKLRFKNLLGQENDKAEALHLLITKGIVKDRVSAIESLFPEHKFPQKSLYRTNAKLKKRLINSLLCTHNEEESNILRTFQDVQKQLYAAKILRAKGKHNAARVIGEEAIKLSIKFEFTDMTLALARDLSLFYALSGNKKKYRYYSGLVSLYQTILNNEIKIEQLYNDTIFSLVGRKHYTSEILDSVKAKAQDVSDILKETKTYWAMLLGANVWIYHYQLSNQNKKVADRCWETINFFESLPYTPPYPAFFSFLYKLIPLQILFKDFSKVRKSIDKCLELASEGTHNWVITKQYEVVMNFHMGKIVEAREIIHFLRTEHANSIKKFRETWLIYEAYGAFLTGEKIRLGKFMNDVPQFSKDKRGMNINILIIQILALLEKEEYNLIIDRMSALERYSYRYLKKDDTFRSNCFIHILLQLEKGHFNLIAVRRHAAKYLKALKTMPLEKSKQDIDVEVIPYEFLWERVEALLK